MKIRRYIVIIVVCILLSSFLMVLRNASKMDLDTNLNDQTGHRFGVLEVVGGVKIIE